MDITWKVIDKYFRDNTHCLVRHHLETYNDFFDEGIQSIFREKNAVKEVKNGLECGISLRDFIDFKEKDIIESYQIKKIERTI